MTTGAFFWFLIFGLNAALFFGIALVVILRGAGELHDLLVRTSNKEGLP